MPQLGAGAGLELSALPWVVTALPSAGFTVLFGRIADLFGRRRTFLTGIALLSGGFSAGALAGGAVGDTLR